MEKTGFFGALRAPERGFLREWFRTCFRLRPGMVKKSFRLLGECKRSPLRKIVPQAP
jgi:hypothetical protein